MLYDLLILGPNVGDDTDFERRRHPDGSFRNGRAYRMRLFAALCGSLHASGCRPLAPRQWST
jgi:hypothetical protein